MAFIDLKEKLTLEIKRTSITRLKQIVDIAVDRVYYLELQSIL